MSRTPQIRRSAGAIVFVLLFAALLASAAPAQPIATSTLLVKFRPQASDSARAAALAGVHGTVSRVIPDIGVHVITVPAPAGAALTRLRANAAVAFAEPDGIARPQEVMPNDPYFLNSGAWNISGGAWGWYQTHTTQAWDITEGSSSVVVAVLDTGLKTAGLSDFDGQVVSGWNVLDNSPDTSSQAGNHGTYVAGTIALAKGNGVGNAGFCPGCRIMPVQVGTDSGASWSDLATGLTWAADHGARIANMSWAGSTDSSTMRAATTYAHQHGVVMTAAAGNSNCNCATYPSADPYVLGIAGVDGTGGKAFDSNYGSWVPLAAPEGNLTAFPSANGQPGYAAFGGTSSAAPVVAAIAGLLLSYNPSLTTTQVEQALEASAAAVPFTVQYGRVDALAALQYLGASDPQPPSAPVQTVAPQLYYAVNGLTSLAPLTVAPQVGQTLVRGVGGWSGSAGLTVSNLQWQHCDPNGAGCAYLGNGAYYTVQTADGGATIKLVFTIKNALGSVQASVLTQPVGGGSTPPAPPANTVPPAISGTAQDGQALTASTGSWSGSPTSYAYQWQRCDSAGGTCAAIAGATSSGYGVQTADVGSTLRVSVTASSSAGSASAASSPTAVVTSAPAPPPNPVPTMQTLTFSGSLNPQNGSRTFSVTVGAGLVDAKLSFSKCSALSLGMSNGATASGPSVLALDATVATGTYTYTVSGGRCSFALTVTAPAP
jgi:subtilisin family serine protease